MFSETTYVCDLRNKFQKPQNTPPHIKTDPLKDQLCQNARLFSYNSIF